mmetsp:Transcript_68620/g.143174  ORF Transcript_68620/g.143174 Transcript_68620/m.143174 type:complete len:201 (+) Transcript_68620:912-1514(+)
MRTGIQLIQDGCLKIGQLSSKADSGVPCISLLSIPECHFKERPHQGKRSQQKQAKHGPCEGCRDCSCSLKKAVVRRTAVAKDPPAVLWEDKDDLPVIRDFHCPLDSGGEQGERDSRRFNLVSPRCRNIRCSDPIASLRRNIGATPLDDSHSIQVFPARFGQHPPMASQWSARASAADTGERQIGECLWSWRCWTSRRWAR